MANYIDQQDYYFGAALSVFFTRNHDAKPALIESTEKDTRCYKMLTDGNHYFDLYMKHSEAPRYAKNGAISWTFNFVGDKEKIKSKIDKGDSVFILLICSEGAFNNTVIAVLTQNEYLKLMHKTSVTVKWEIAKVDRKQTFTIPNRKGVQFSVDCNRIITKFSEIKDAV